MSRQGPSPKSQLLELSSNSISPPGITTQVLSFVAAVIYVDHFLQDPNDNGFVSIAIDPPTFANGTTIPNGQFRLLLRALKVTGDPTNEADFESFLSPIIGVNAP